MPERLVDVEKQGAKLLHTFPVQLRDEAHAAEEEAFKSKALEAAAHARIVPDEDLPSLNAKMHVPRGGPLGSFGDPLGVLAETREGLEQLDREHAYALWEQAGRPEGRADEFWHEAQRRRFCERAYAVWEREGRPDDKAHEHWCRVRAFEE